MVIEYIVGFNTFSHDPIIVKHFVDGNTKTPGRKFQQKAQLLGGVPRLQASPNIRSILEE